MSNEELTNSIGSLISANTEAGISIKLTVPSEHIHVGQPLIVEGESYSYYCLVAGLEYPPDPQVAKLANSPYKDQYFPVHFVESGLPKQQAIAFLTPLAAIPKDNPNESVEADTIPPYYCPVRLASPEDLKVVYKETDYSRSAGHLPGFADFEVPIDLKELVSLPFATFGKTGAGKTIFELILAGNILHAGVAQLVVIDPHDSFGYRSRDAFQAPGLKFFFPDQIAVIGLDPNRIDENTDFQLVLDYNELTISDIILMCQDLSDPMIRALYTFDDNKSVGKSLILTILEASTDWVKELDIHKGVFRALVDRLQHLTRFDFIHERDKTTKTGQIIFLDDLPKLLKQGKSLVFSMGEYAEDISARLLLANVLGRRLDYWYRRDFQDVFPRLVFILEEAHLFLSSEIAHHTVFPKMIRETRKFKLVLAIVDQMPSEIPSKVLSQISTRFVLRLEDANDIQAAISRKVDPRAWTPILRRMRKRQVFAIGDAITVPTIFSVQNYKENLMAKKWEIDVVTRDLIAKLSNADIAQALKKNS